MSDNQMKILIVVLIIIIIGIGVGLFFNINKSNEEYEKLQQEVQKYKEEEKEKEQQKENNEEKVEINKIKGITNTKIYNTLIKKVIDKNLYIEVEVNGIVTKKAIKEYNLYSSTNNIDTIIKDGMQYNINNNDKTLTMEIANNSEIEISFIDVDIAKYADSEIEIGKEIYKGSMFDYEVVNNIKYYYENDALKYVINNGVEIIINNIKDAEENIFEIPAEYEMIPTNN